MNKLISCCAIVGAIFISCTVNAWEGQVTNILQHGDYVAITLSPDPGVGSCTVGSPYLMAVDETVESKQRFSMVLSALMSAKKIAGYDDGCATAIWGSSRPLIRRLNLRAN